jgi:hypothetical protein
MSDTLEMLVRRLYEARAEAKTARQIRNAARAEAGDCSAQTYEQEGPCWLRKKEKWCESCASVLPHYEVYHKASDKAGAALRSVLREGKKLAEETP